LTEITPKKSLHPDPGAARVETDRELLDRLRRLRAAGRLALELDHRRLSHIDSPVAVEAESTRWIYGGLALVAATWWFLGGAAGAAAAILGLAAYLTLGKADVRRRTARRVEERALGDVALWRRLWRFGGVALTAEGRRCAAPEGNWMQFVRDVADPTEQARR
jgi:hypothetical protein